MTGRVVIVGGGPGDPDRASRGQVVSGSRARGAPAVVVVGDVGVGVDALPGREP